ncbi:MAG TPA: hypothetical protein VNZ53_56700 [Steroidobacteraceae bacterium]|nr:hypothetical protein [Steroidobacteraceae bacterium]
MDIDLPIADVAEDSGLVRITARGELDGAAVGFELVFPSGATKRTGGKLSFPIGTAQFRSIGTPSNNFVALLSRQYKLPTTPLTMVPKVDASVVGLEGDPANVLSGMTKMKFFFYDSGPESRYAEVFINVDAKRRILEFHEKDSEYRKPLLLALTRGP